MSRGATGSGVLGTALGLAALAILWRTVQSVEWRVKMARVLPTEGFGDGCELQSALLPLCTKLATASAAGASTCSAAGTVCMLLVSRVDLGGNCSSITV